MSALERYLPRYSLRTLAVFMLLVTSGMGLWFHWEPWAPSRELFGRADYATWPGPVFSPCGRFVSANVTWTDDDFTQLTSVWSVGTGRQLLSIKADDIAFSPDGTRLFVWHASDGDFRALLYDVPKAERLYTEVTDCTSAENRFSPDGSVFLGFTMERTSRLWSLPEGECIREFSGPDVRYWSGFSDDGKLLLASDAAGRLCVLDARSGEQRCALGPLDRLRQRAALLAGGERVIAWTREQVASWDLSGKEIYRFTTDEAVAAWPEAGVLAVADAGQVDLRDVMTGELRRALKGHGQKVSSMKLSKNGARLAAEGQHDVVIVWEVVTGKLVSTIVIGGRERGFFGFSPDGTLLLTAEAPEEGGDYRLVVWDVAGARRLRELPGAACGWFSDDGSEITGSGHGRTIIWSTSSWESRMKPPGPHVDQVGELTTVTDEFTMRVRRTGAEKDIAELGIPGWDLPRALVSPDGSVAATIHSRELVAVRDSVTGAKLFSLDGHIGVIYASVFSGDGRTIATGGWSDGTVRLWSAETGRPIATLEGGSGSVHNLWLSPDGRLLVASHDAETRVWELPSGRCTAVIDRCLWDVVFSSDCSVILATRNNDLQVWRMPGGELVAEMKGHVEYVEGSRFSPSEKRIVSRSSRGSEIRIWDASSGECLATVPWGSAKYGDPVSPDGRLIAAVSRAAVPVDDAERVVDVWDVESGSLVRRLGGHAGTIRRVVWSPALRRLAVTDSAGVHVWDARDGRLLTELALEGGGEDAAFSADGRMLAVAADPPEAEGVKALVRIYRRRRPERWWGVFCMAELWATVLFAGVLAWSVWRDRKSLSREAA